MKRVFHLMDKRCLQTVFTDEIIRIIVVVQVHPSRINTYLDHAENRLSVQEIGTSADKGAASP